MTSSRPPVGTVMKEHVNGSDGLLHAGIFRCGPAAFRANPRSVLPPPEKNFWLSGTWLPDEAASKPTRRLFAQTIPCRFLYAAACPRNLAKFTLDPRTLGFTSNSRLSYRPLCASSG